MKTRLLISALMVLLSFTATSQISGSEFCIKYPQLCTSIPNESLRIAATKIERGKIDSTKLDHANQVNQKQQAVIAKDSVVIEGLQAQHKNDSLQNVNLKDQGLNLAGQFRLCNETLERQDRRSRWHKGLAMVTTTATIILGTIVIFKK